MAKASIETGGSKFARAGVGVVPQWRAGFTCPYQTKAYLEGGFAA